MIMLITSIALWGGLHKKKFSFKNKKEDFHFHIALVLLLSPR